MDYIITYYSPGKLNMLNDDSIFTYYGLYIIVLFYYGNLAQFKLIIVKSLENIINRVDGRKSLRSENKLEIY